MKQLKIKCGEYELNTSIEDIKSSKKVVLFLSGGGITLGRGRFLEWQNNLQKLGISSVSFDYSGVNNSGVSLEKSSLDTRIEEAFCVFKCILENTNAKEFIIYGVSMGGYVALGLSQQFPIVSKLILHAPAAYSQKAHRINFGEKFSKELHKQNSWEDSLSFDWFGKYVGDVLFIEAENEKIITPEILKEYKKIKKNNTNFTTFLLPNAEHLIWSDSEIDKSHRKLVYKNIVKFIN